jgi:lipoprotein-anchoring transpeptidase ErfK/SrfK
VAVLLLAGCGSRAAAPPPPPPAKKVLAVKTGRCTAGELLPLGSAAQAYVGIAPHGAVALRTSRRSVEARFGKLNVNGYQTVFGVLGAIVHADCTPAFYRVQLPIKPNGAIGYVRATSLELQTVPTRIVVDVSARRLTLFEHGRRALTATVAVGSPATPTPIGRFYVNQRLIPADTSGPYGPAAIGISAYSNVLTGWAQGGPVAIHGTDEPWSIGHAASNGCIRLPNATLSRLFKIAVAGTPVIIHP